MEHSRPVRVLFQDNAPIVFEPFENSESIRRRHAHRQGSFYLPTVRSADDTVDNRIGFPGLSVFEVRIGHKHVCHAFKIIMPENSPALSIDALGKYAVSL